MRAPATAAPLPAPVKAPGFKGGFHLTGGLGVGEVVTDRQLSPLVRVHPMYPQKAAQRGVEGWVEVEFTISKTGTVKDPKVVAAEPSRIFNRAALRAIRKWKYKPELVDGEAVPVYRSRHPGMLSQKVLPFAHGCLDMPVRLPVDL